jgi:rhodanese-related sulfurtransferase
MGGYLLQQRRIEMTSPVSSVNAAPSQVALEHFSRRLSLETDCSDVFSSSEAGTKDFILVDVRGEKAFAAGHVPGAINLPHRQINRERLAQFPEDSLFVVYCAGPHCNGANKAAVKFAELGRPVKEMIGGITGWLDEGFSLVTSEQPALAAAS